MLSISRAASLLICWGIVPSLFLVGLAVGIRCPSRCQCFDPLEVHCRHARLFNRRLPAAGEVTIEGSNYGADFLLSVLQQDQLEYLHLIGANCNVLDALAQDFQKFVVGGGYLKIEGRCPDPGELKVIKFLSRVFVYIVYLRE